MPRNVEFNEEEAIQKAMEVFWEKGYKATSLRDLTEAMKINSSSLYNTIGDKQELFLRAVRHYTALRKKDLLGRMASKESPLIILTKYINDSVEVIIGKQHGCMAVKMAFEVGASDPQVKEILTEDSNYAYQFLYNLIKKAIAENEITSEEDPELLADFFISIWTGWYEQYILHKNPLKIRKMADYFIRQLTK